MPTNPKRIFREAIVDTNLPPKGYQLEPTDIPSTRKIVHHLIHIGTDGKETKVGEVHAIHHSKMYGDDIPNASVAYLPNENAQKFSRTPLLTDYGVSEPYLGHMENDEKVPEAATRYFNSAKSVPPHIKAMRQAGTFEVRPQQPELPMELPRIDPEKLSNPRGFKESTQELLKLALEERPNAFREVFDEIMLAKIVDISDEMKDEIAQSMFGESSHKYGKKKKPHKGEMGESFEPEEDEDEYEDVGDEDEDFDISDEELEDLDLDDLDFEDEEDEK